MRITPFILCTVTLGALLSFSQHAHASAADPRIKLLADPSEKIAMPEEFQKEWVLDSCESGSRIIRFSRYFHMRSVMKESRITRTEGVVLMGRNTYKVSMPRDVSMITLKKNGDLLQFYPRPGDLPTIAAVESGRALASFFKFKSCDGKRNNFVIEDRKMLALLPRLDRMHESCPQRDDLLKESCQSAVLGLFDLNGDNKIDLHEMNDAWQTIGVYHGGQGSSCAAPSVTNVAAVGQDSGTLAEPANNASLPYTPVPATAAPAPMTIADGTPYFEWLIDNLDRDGDQAISYSEVRGQWDRMNKDSLMTAFILTLTTAEGKLRYLPQPEDAPK